MIPLERRSPRDARRRRDAVQARLIVLRRERVKRYLRRHHIETWADVLLSVLVMLTMAGMVLAQVIDLHR